MSTRNEGVEAIKQLRSWHFLVADLLLLIPAVYGSYVLRLERFILGDYWGSFLIMITLAMVLTPLIFRWFGIYSHYWVYASVEELLLLGRAVTTATVLTGILSILSISLLLGSLQTFPLSIPFIFYLLALTATTIPRVIARIMYGRVQQHRLPSTDISPVIVMGAGDAGTMIVRELRRNPQIGMDVIGFLDDDPAKLHMRIHGIPVLGNRHDIPDMVKRYGLRWVIIAMPAASGKAIRDIMHICEDANVQARTMPGIYELLDGKVSVNQLRSIQIEDLLRREPIQTDVDAVRDLIRGTCVLVTGGGGSIGSELCRQILRFEPATLIALGHGENSVFEITNELRRTLQTLHSDDRNGRPTSELRAVIADIRFPDRIQAIFEQFRPNLVFHAAAHKHVPLMEINPAEAITNNVIGTRNVLDSALAVGVERFVMISSDKAVNPTSVMGVTKRVAELLVHQAATRSGKPYVTSRFGNVLGSRGSVVLTFKQQIDAGGPITITHPDMRRFFMTIPEAVQLVLQAAVLGRGGEVFMFDMGEPVRIVDLARDMIILSGLEVGRDIDIQFSGVRPGEKLFEELFLPDEVYQPTCHEKISIAVNDSSFVPEQLNQTVYDLEIAAQNHQNDTIIALLKQLIPEFSHSDTAQPNESGTHVPMNHDPVQQKHSESTRPDTE